jgi:hypothetical protein
MSMLAWTLKEECVGVPPPVPLSLRLQGMMTRCWPKSLPTITRLTYTQTRAHTMYMYLIASDR